MILPFAPYASPQTQDFIGAFGGLNRLLSAGEHEFSELRNLCGDEAPLIGTRARRATVKQFGAGEAVNGFGCKNAILYTIDQGETAGYSKLFLNDREVADVQLNREKKTIIGMGAYAVIFPDGFFINTVEPSDHGFIAHRREIEATAQVPLHLTPCTYDGSALTGGTVGPTAPASPANGAVWVDTSGDVTVYKIWNEGTGSWAQMSTVYIRFDYGSIGDGFRQWDGVSISGLTSGGVSISGLTSDAVPQRVRDQVAALNLEGALLQQADTDFIEIAGILDRAVEVTGTIVIERKQPQLDYITEANNRLWGCRFGVVDGKVVNEILACKQGDCTNWQSYPGISTDSYAMSLGTDGAFTGATTYLGTPVFFKENFIHKIYGSTPATFSMQQMICRGVGRDCGESVVTTGSAVFYRSAVDWCAWGGSYPQEIGRKLGKTRPDVVRGDWLGNKVYYYVEEGTARFLLVFDTDTGAWYQEDSDEILAFARDGHVLYALTRKDGVFRIDALGGEVRTLLFDEHTDAIREDPVQWSATTGAIGYGDTHAKYLKQIQLRAKKAPGSTLRLEVSYDGGAFRPVASQQGAGDAKAVTFTLKPVRCDALRLRLSGTGDCTLVSISKTIAQGSEKT